MWLERVLGRLAMLLRAFAAVISVITITGFFFDCTPGHRITKATFDKIELGMGECEVRAMLGDPGSYFGSAEGRFYGEGVGWHGGPYIDKGARALAAYDRRWNGDHG